MDASQERINSVALKNKVSPERTDCKISSIFTLPGWLTTFINITVYTLEMLKTEHNLT